MPQPQKTALNTAVLSDISFISVTLETSQQLMPALDAKKPMEKQIRVTTGSCCLMYQMHELRGLLDGHHQPVLL